MRILQIHLIAALMRAVTTSDTDVHADKSCPCMGAVILANLISLWKSPCNQSCYIARICTSRFIAGCQHYFHQEFII